MSQEKIRSLVNQLQQEIAKGERPDEQTLSMVRELDRKVEALLAASDDENAPLMDDAIALEAKFAATHPVAERLLRELIDTLARIGI